MLALLPTTWVPPVPIWALPQVTWDWQALHLVKKNHQPLQLALH
jgi:hypothetical protein